MSALSYALKEKLVKLYMSAQICLWHTVHLDQESVTNITPCMFSIKVQRDNDLMVLLQYFEVTIPWYKKFVIGTMACT
jgi:hypothetical protein